MASYATSARLQGAAPHFAGTSERPGERARNDAIAAEPPSAADRIELAGRPLDAAIGDWLASIGEAWSQMTFFLFDPDSWR